MKIGRRFRREGRRYEFLGFVGKKRWRVRDLESGKIVHILSHEAEKERKRLRDEKEREEKRLRDEKEREEKRLRDEVEQLTNNVEALRKLRDHWNEEPMNEWE